MSVKRASCAIVAIACVLALCGCAGQAWDEATRKNTVAGYRSLQEAEESPLAVFRLNADLSLSLLP